jgi:RsmE family RNA methyltransferase
MKAVKEIVLLAAMKWIVNSSKTHAWLTKFPSKYGNFPGIKHRYIHQTTSLKLNRFLFDPTEIDEHLPGRKTSDFPLTVTLPKQDYRTVHVAKTLGLQNNETLRAGIVKDNVIKMKTSHTNKYNQTISSGLIVPCTENSKLYGGLETDSATVRWIPEGKIKKAEPTKNGDPPGSLEITLHSMTPYNDSKVQNDNSDQHDSPQISLILALPRPLALARLLPMISMMGISHLILTSAQKVPKDYFGSHLFRKPNEIRKLLIEGLCQAGDVKIPSVTVVNRLKPFLEDDLENLFPTNDWARVIAHPQRKDISDNQVLRMEDISFPASTFTSDERRSASPSNMLLAVGPEGGWAEPYELDMFQDHGFQQVTLGSRILRSDVAVVSLLSLAHDVCARRSRI